MQRRSGVAGDRRVAFLSGNLRVAFLDLCGALAMTDYPEPDEPREAALRAAVLDLSAAVLGGGATREELVAAMEAVRQIPIDLERMTNALHVPSDAGEYEDILRALLERIPDGWGAVSNAGRAGTRSWPELRSSWPDRSQLPGPPDQGEVRHSSLLPGKGV